LIPRRILTKLDEMWRFLLVFLALEAAALAEPRARALNARGYALYKQGKLVQALALFRQATEADDRHALAHYNAACVLSLLRARGKTCEHDAYRSTILEGVRKAVRLDPKLRSRALADPDLASIRDTFGYQLLAGRSVSRTEDLRAILVAVTWYGPAPGAYGPMSGLDFHEDGTVDTWTLDVSGDRVRRRQGKARFSVEGTTVTIHVEGKRPRRQTGKLGRDGRLRFSGHLGPYTDDPDDCSA
jgi:tetratricopeptide (TPR) repeat protein